MGILEKSAQNTNTVEKHVTRIKNKALSNYNQIVDMYEKGLSAFWNHPKHTPQEIAESLGPDALEVFMIHGALGQFLASINPDAKITDVSTLGAFTMNEDGTVTIDSVVSQEEKE